MKILRLLAPCCAVDVREGGWIVCVTRARTVESSACSYGWIVRVLVREHLLLPFLCVADIEYSIFDGGPCVHIRQAYAKGLAGVMLWEGGQDAMGTRESLLVAATNAAAAAAAAV